MIEIDFSKLSILMVDDNPKNLQLLGSTLKKEGLKSEFAINATQALNWLNKKRFDLILLDIMMPEVDGLELCRQLRQKKEFDDVPVIFITARNDIESVVEGFKVGGQDYITKPFDSRELIARVRTHLEISFHRENLKNLNKHLEEKVRDRTIELEIANHNLEKAHKDVLEMDKAKSEFVQMISNEIRTPLNGINSSVQFLGEYIEDSNISNLVDVLNISVKQLEQFAETAMLITELRNKSKQLDKIELKLSKIIEHARVENDEIVQAYNLKITLNNIEDITIKAEEKLMNICFQIILGNAFKYSNPMSEIVIEYSREGQYDVVEIIDGGDGFSNDLIADSGKYYHADDSSSGDLGINMVLVNMILEAHKGKIELRNIEDQGGAVKLYLPF